MIRKGMTRLEAARMWVKEFNAIPTQMIAKLMIAEPESWNEVTQPAIGDRVYVYEEGSGKVIGLYHNDLLYKVRLDNGSIWRGRAELFEVEHYDSLPMWGTMWSFGDSLDNYWLEEKGGIALMSQCGFRIFMSEEFGYFFGIDGAGYDFYEAHWIPLYDKRGLKWHDPETDNEVIHHETKE